MHSKDSLKCIKCNLTGIRKPQDEFKLYFYEYLGVMSEHFSCTNKSLNTSLQQRIIQCKQCYSTRSCLLFHLLFAGGSRKCLTLSAHTHTHTLAQLFAYYGQSEASCRGLCLLEKTHLLYCFQQLTFLFCTRGGGQSKSWSAACITVTHWTMMEFKAS